MKNTGRWHSEKLLIRGITYGSQKAVLVSAEGLLSSVFPSAKIGDR